MADDRAYRVQIRFDAEDDTFTASVPELDLDATAETRAEALTLIEDAIDTRMREAAEGTSLPEPASTAEVETTLEMELAPAIARELAYFADQSKLSVAALATQLVTRGIGVLEGRKAAEAKRAPQEEDQQPQERGRGKGRRRGRREGYRPDMENQANWMEHLRNLEKGGGGGGRGGGGGGRGGRGGGGRGRR